MIEKITVDFAVIGSGPAGQKAAIQAAKLKKSCCIIENGTYVGGNSLNSATIPSKSLREAILDMTRYNERSFYNSSCINEVTIFDLNDRLKSILDAERAVLVRQFKKNKILYLQGQAAFKNSHLLEIRLENQLVAEVEAKYILIATGSKPRNPLHVPFDGEVIVDSNTLLKIDRVPKSLLVLGGGVIGAEYASFFAALGTKVYVLDKKERLLPSLDAEIGIHLQVGLQEIGLNFIPCKIPDKIYKEGQIGHVICTDKSHFEADVILYALGREANVGMLNLQNANLDLNERGYIRVNHLFQTKCDTIYAAGDVIGHPALASTSMEQGRLAARNALGAEGHDFPTFFPLGIYTIPEISCCGYTEEELVQKGITYEIGRAYYYEIARSHISGSSHLGMFKILFNRETLEILGIHIVGRNATEVIHIGQVAMSFGAKLDYFVNQIFNYPTFAEGYRIAAFNGLNKL